MIQIEINATENFSTSYYSLNILELLLALHPTFVDLFLIPEILLWACVCH